MFCLLLDGYEERLTLGSTGDKNISDTINKWYNEASSRSHTATATSVALPGRSHSSRQEKRTFLTYENWYQKTYLRHDNVVDNKVKIGGKNNAKQIMIDFILMIKL